MAKAEFSEVLSAPLCPMNTGVLLVGMERAITKLVQSDCLHKLTFEFFAPMLKLYRGRTFMNLTEVRALRISA